MSAPTPAELANTDQFAAHWQQLHAEAVAEIREAIRGGDPTVTMCMLADSFRRLVHCCPDCATRVAYGLAALISEAKGEARA
ncbi:hypothetical protein ACAG26_24250 [Mycobacterium sp. pUA109]|uniref:hypothetical protein n=1 Tax=Mycobacterium sp. pUA109 TaxID=3238982 RepID=UPI00351B2DD1